LTHSPVPCGRCELDVRRGERERARLFLVGRPGRERAHPKRRRGHEAEMDAPAPCLVRPPPNSAYRSSRNKSPRIFAQKVTVDFVCMVFGVPGASAVHCTYMLLFPLCRRLLCLQHSFYLSLLRNSITFILPLPRRTLQQNPAALSIWWKYSRY
jgi:hypothetical protein